MAGLIVVLVFAVVVLFVLARTIRIVPQARAGIVERLGRYSRTLDAGLAIIVPFVDRLKPLIDLREQVVSFPPQPVITEDNLVVNIDTVIYFQVTDPKSATYEIADYIGAIEQLTVTTLRNVIGGMTLEDTLTSRDQINAALRTVLDEATGKWGIRVNRVELKAVDPPGTIQEAMEKQMRAERDKRAAILQAEGYKQSQILTAEGEKQSAILKAEGQREAQVLNAQGQSKAIETVFDAIHRGDADPKLLAYQYLQMLPQIAQGESNKVWIIPSEFTAALGDDGQRRRRQRRRRRAHPAGPATGAAGPACARRVAGVRAKRRPVAWEGDVRHALRTPSGGTRRRTLARGADRGRHQQGDAPDPPGAARGRRQLPGRQAVHLGGQGARARGAGAAVAEPGPAGREAG